MNAKFNLFNKCIISILAYFQLIIPMAFAADGDQYQFKNSTCGIGGTSAFSNFSGSPLQCAQQWVLQFSQNTTICSGIFNLTANQTSVNFQATRCQNGYPLVGNFYISGSYVLSTPAPTPKPTPTPPSCGPKIGQSAGNRIWSVSGAGDNKGDACASQCKIQINDYKCASVTGKTYCSGFATYTGQKCNAGDNPVLDESPSAESPNPNASPTPVPPLNPDQERGNCVREGKSSAEVNGKIICIKPNPDSPVQDHKTETSEKTDSEGKKVKEKIESDSKDGGDGKVKTDTTKTTTTEQGGLRPDGTRCNTEGGCQDIKTESKEESKDDYCKANPKSKQCLDHNKSFSGSCTSAMKCENEDPATCEIAKLAWQSKCNDEKEKTDALSSDLYQSGLNTISGQDGDSIKSTLGVTGTTNTLDIQTYLANSSNGFLSCGNLSDKNISVFGKSIIIPFSKMNYWLDIMGKIAVAFTLVVSAKIIVGGRK